ncbi:MAG: hypothetical protein JRN15_10825 [Nitrososphaerota archaeon]|nr:hypothetical protein [Nitrososphaerota archaeon]
MTNKKKQPPKTLLLSILITLLVLAVNVILFGARMVYTGLNLTGTGLVAFGSAFIAIGFVFAVVIFYKWLRIEDNVSKQLEKLNETTKSLYESYQQR